MELEKLIVNVKIIASCQTSKLVIVDTTAAPLCMLSVNSILARCVGL